MKHSDTKLHKKNIVDQNLEGARACCAPYRSATEYLCHRYEMKLVKVLKKNIYTKQID